MLFRLSLFVSTFMALFIGTTKDSGFHPSNLIEALDVPINPVGIEKVYGYDGGCGGDAGGCCGSSSSDGGIDFPPGPSTSGVGIRFSPPAKSEYTCGGCGGCGCFISGTKITMADGSKKDIDMIVVGDVVKTKDQDEPVRQLYTIPYTGNLYAFNNSEHYFVSSSHPFMTKDGWRSIDPAETAKESKLVVEQLVVGDEILRQDGSFLPVTSIIGKPFETTVYNFDVNNSHAYFADGYYAHNVATEQVESNTLALARPQK